MNGKIKNSLTVAVWVMTILIVAGVTFTFKLAYATHEDQGEHNIDKEAHPSIAGQLTMIERDLTTLSEEVSANSAVLDEVHDAQIEQKMMLQQIQRSVEPR